MKLPLFICAILLLGCGRVANVTTSLPNADSTASAITQTSERLVSYRQLDSAENYLSRLSTTPATKRDPIIYNAWLRAAAQVRIARKNYGTADSLLTIARTTANQIDTGLSYKAATYILTGKVLSYQHDYDSAYYYLQTGYQLARKDTTVLLSAIRGLASFGWTTGGQKNQIRYLTEGAKLATTPEDQLWFNNNLGVYYARTHQFDSAITYLSNAVYDDRVKDPETVIARLENLGGLYAVQGEFEQALQSNLQATRLMTIYNMADPNTYTNVARLYMMLHDFAAAERYLDTAQDMGRRLDIGAMPAIFRFRGQVALATGNLPAAMAAKDSAYAYHLLVDSVNLINVANTIEAKYMVKQKDQEIHSLEKDNIASKKLATQRVYIIIAMIIGAAGLSAGGYSFFHRKELLRITQQQQLQQQLLRSQMEPHFIINALAHLEAFIQAGQLDKAIQYLHAFSRLTSITLENARQSEVTLLSELQALEAYLKLAEMNLEGRFSYQLNFYEDFDDDYVLVPPMVLQPFVENALKHGIPQLIGGGRIAVTVERFDIYVHCTIEDNGVGLSQQPKTGKRPSLSTTITKQRLELLSRQTKQPAYFKTIDRSTEGSRGVRVEIRLPFTYFRSQHSTTVTTGDHPGAYSSS